MNSENTQKHQTDGLAALIVFAIFAICIVMTLFAGAGVYKRINARDASAFTMRTMSQYITTRVRSSQSPDSIRVEKFGDTNALCITDEISGERYTTYIYLDGGYMKELYASDSSNIKPEYGEKLLEAELLDFSLQDGLLKVSAAAPEGERSDFSLNIRGRESVS